MRVMISIVCAPNIETQLRDAQSTPFALASPRHCPSAWGVRWLTRRLLVYYAKREDLFNLPQPASAITEFALSSKQSLGSPKAMFTHQRTSSR